VNFQKASFQKASYKGMFNERPGTLKQEFNGDEEGDGEMT